MKNELMKCAGVAKTHFGFGRMHVYIHLCGIHFEE